MINLSCASAGGSVAGWDPVGHHILVRFTQQSFPVPWSVAALERGTLLGALSSTDSLENLSLAIFSGSIAGWGVTGPVVIDALTLLNKLFGAFVDCSVAAWDVPGRDAVAGLIRSPDARTPGVLRFEPLLGAGRDIIDSPCGLRRKCHRRWHLNNLFVAVAGINIVDCIFEQPR